MVSVTVSCCWALKSGGVARTDLSSGENCPHAPKALRLTDLTSQPVISESSQFTGWSVWVCVCVCAGSDWGGHQQARPSKRKKKKPSTVIVFYCFMLKSYRSNPSRGLSRDGESLPPSQDEDMWRELSSFLSLSLLLHSFSVF